MQAHYIKEYVYHNNNNNNNNNLYLYLNISDIPLNSWVPYRKWLGTHL